nr:YhjD/YihY/BrkB family envelope integrity protein [Kineosporia mesophila]
MSVFPLLLLLASVLGFILQDNPTLQKEILDSALRQFPVIGDQLGDPTGLRGSATAVAIGLAGSLYGALGIANATQNAMNTMWAVPRNRRPNPIAARLRSLFLLAVGGLTFIITGSLGGIGTNVNGFADFINFNEVLRLVSGLTGITLIAVFFMFLFRWGTTRKLSRLDVLPGAIAAAIVWQMLQQFGTVYVGSVVRHADATNGVFAIVLGLIAWIYLAVVSLLICAEANVVRVRHLYPRTLLTPFTDDVDLTEADQRAYRSYARAQRTKDFEWVDVGFENDGQNATARRRRRLARSQAKEALRAQDAQESPAVREMRESPGAQGFPESEGARAPETSRPSGGPGAADGPKATNDPMGQGRSLGARDPMDARGSDASGTVDEVLSGDESAPDDRVARGRGATPTTRPVGKAGESGVPVVHGSEESVVTGAPGVPEARDPHEPGVARRD